MDLESIANLGGVAAFAGLVYLQIKEIKLDLMQEIRDQKSVHESSLSDIKDQMVRQSDKLADLSESIVRMQERGLRLKSPTTSPQGSVTFQRAYPRGDTSDGEF